MSKFNPTPCNPDCTRVCPPCQDEQLIRWQDQELNDPNHVPHLERALVRAVGMFDADGGIDQRTFLNAIAEDVKRAMRRLVVRGEVVLDIDFKLSTRGSDGFGSTGL